MDIDGPDKAEPTPYPLPDNYLAKEASEMRKANIMGASTTSVIRGGEREGLELDLDHVFSYHAPTPYQRTQYELIRSAAKTLAAVIEANTPRCADQQAAIRHVREAVMTANAAIALRGRLSR